MPLVDTSWFRKYLSIAETNAVTRAAEEPRPVLCAELKVVLKCLNRDDVATPLDLEMDVSFPSVWE